MVYIFVMVGFKDPYRLT